MKNKVQIKPNINQKTSVKVTLVYTALGVAIAGIIISIIALIINLNKPTDAKANNATYSTFQSGAWSSSSSWSGDTPASNLNQDQVIINSYHEVIHSGTLGVQNNTSFNINSHGVLTIDGNLIVNNSLSLNINGTLIITGSLITNNEAQITINGGGSLDINENVTLNNQATLIVNGTMDVGNDMSIGNESTFIINNEGVFTTGGNLAFGANATINNNNVMDIGGEVSFDTSPDQFGGTGDVTMGGAGCSDFDGDGSCTENILLPVKLVSFTANAEGQKVRLEWSTTEEINNDYFTIERSTDGVKFEKLTTQPGKGTTKSVSEYQFTDENPIAKNLYYRLSQTDFDGTTEIFRPTYVSLDQIAENNVSVYPNPMVGNELTLKVSRAETGQIELYDQAGNLIHSQKTNNHSLITKIEIGHAIHEGVYLLRYSSPSQEKSLKVIKQ